MAVAQLCQLEVMLLLLKGMMLLDDLDKMST